MSNVNIIKIAGERGLPIITGDLNFYYSNCFIRVKKENSFNIGFIMEFVTRGSRDIVARISIPENTNDNIIESSFYYLKNNNDVIINPELDLSLPKCGYKNVKNETFLLRKRLNLQDQRKKGFYVPNYIIDTTLQSKLDKSKIDIARYLKDYTFLWDEYPSYEIAMDKILSKECSSIAISPHLLIAVNPIESKIELYRHNIPISTYIFSRQRFKLLNNSLQIKSLKLLNIPYE